MAFSEVNIALQLQPAICRVIFYKMLAIYFIIFFLIAISSCHCFYPVSSFFGVIFFGDFHINLSRANKYYIFFKIVYIIICSSKLSCFRCGGNHHIKQCPGNRKNDDRRSGDRYSRRSRAQDSRHSHEQDSRRSREHDSRRSREHDFGDEPRR